MRVGLRYDPNGRLSTGLRVIAEAVIRRLDQSAGTLFYSDDDYGESLVDMIGRNLSDSQIDSLISGQLTKDERILAVSTEVTRSEDGETFEIEVKCETPRGVFDLTFEVNQLATKVTSKEISGLTGGLTSSTVGES